MVAWNGFYPGGSAQTSNNKKDADGDAGRRTVKIASSRSNKAGSLRRQASGLPSRCVMGTTMQSVCGRRRPSADSGRRAALFWPLAPRRLRKAPPPPPPPLPSSQTNTIETPSPPPCCPSFLLLVDFSHASSKHPKTGPRQPPAQLSSLIPTASHPRLGIPPTNSSSPIRIPDLLASTPIHRIWFLSQHGLALFIAPAVLRLAIYPGLDAIRQLGKAHPLATRPL